MDSWAAAPEEDVEELLEEESVEVFLGELEHSSGAESHGPESRKEETLAGEKYVERRDNFFTVHAP